MNKNELIKQIAAEGEVTIVEANAFYNLFEKVLFEAITNNDEVVLGKALGRFVIQKTKAQKRPEMKAIQQKNGQMKFQPTGKMIKYPASYKVSFKVSKGLKVAVKN